MTFTIPKLVETVANSSLSTFYRDLWNLPDALPLGRSTLTHIPLTNATHLASRPFLKRLYVKGGLYTKVVHAETVSFLAAKTKRDVLTESYGSVAYERPLVMFQNPQESIEKGLWVYSKNLLPLIAEDNLTITLLAAERYQVDALIIDAYSLQDLCAHTIPESTRTRIRSIVLVDRAPTDALLRASAHVFPHAALHLTLSLPETGPLAHLCPESVSGRPIYHPDPLTHLDITAEGALIATRLALLPTPIINYDTGITVRHVESHCMCAEALAFSVHTPV